MTPEQKSVLDLTLKEIEKHKFWIHRNYKLLSGQVPFTQHSWAERTEETVMLVDQLLFRWQRLQDALAQRGLPVLYEVLEQRSASEVTFLDIVHRMEQLGILKSAELWSYFRGIRNSLAHDYPESDAAVVQGVNSLLERLVEFLEMVQNIQNEMQRLV